MPRNRFEQVDEVQPDAITLSLWKGEAGPCGKVDCPAALAGGRLTNDLTSDDMAAKDAFRVAVRMANEIKAPVVVVDPAALWDKEWGDLFRPVDD